MSTENPSSDVPQNSESQPFRQGTTSSQSFFPLRAALPRSLRKSSRPSTAPAREDVEFLPSLPTGQLTAADNVHHFTLSDFKNKKLDLVHHMQTVDEDEIDTAPNLVLSSFPSPFDGDTDGSILSSRTEGPFDTGQSDYDWATFINAYASGRWDPRRTPNPPRSYTSSSSNIGFSLITELPKPPVSAPIGSIQPSLDGHQDSRDATAGYEDHLQLQSDHIQAHLRTMNESPVYQTPETLAGHLTVKLPIPSRPSPAFRRFQPAPPTNLSLPNHRIRGSFSASSAHSTAATDKLTSISAHSQTDVQTTVATLRWAAASVDISPLALPSPEHELTDPMRGVTATVPGSYPLDLDSNVHDHPMTPGGTRMPHLASFWHGTTDVEKNDDIYKRNTAHLTTTSNSSPDTRTIPPTQDSSEPLNSLSDVTGTLPAASAPLANNHHSDGLIPGDYFGAVAALTEPQSSTNKTSAGSDTAQASVPTISYHTTPDSGTMTVPAHPRRVCLTRQTSSPLPTSLPHESRYISGRISSESIMSAKGGRAAKEEQMFAELGYLVPPNPPEELERRRALYKFNIWNTGPDLNFDRIAHLAKLVFSTKGVVVSLIDGNEQWFKSEWGVKTSSHARIHSFCAHAILQRGDEPMVVLDTHLDWRFMKNPLVSGAPYVRFYAGAPLRTQDGYNIGTLAIIDEFPREDFSPRQRHTLKEFAAIAMREMELWRDKIQLRIRDRIQNSMEQFSRECLEIDTEAHAQSKDRPDLIVGSSMDKVYDRAAKLVMRTLDVEGVIVMDVSHCEVLENMSAEGSVSVIMHYGDPQLEPTTRQLSTAEYHKLNAFFAKHPDGKISEGIVPPSFRPFLPTRIQYALTVPIFNIDKRPFALLCAYNVSDQTKRYLEGHELSYLRAIGVIILSAVLKRRMILADKAKSLFISNISHELRTPLHGILAAAELLGDSQLTHSQLSFLQTVQACGTSLVETVNHVLDFTKLSGNSKAGGVENVIVPSKVDLVQLVEEAVDGCWIGHHARTTNTADSGIGSVYSPPKEDQDSSVRNRKVPVETVIDIGYRPQGWLLKCEKGGIRRVLMNVFGNSLKFTTEGFVHVVLRQLPSGEEDPPNKIKVELTVLDTGKGISQNFLKNQLFHPFSQENPLQTGTGLGLAIVNSIVTSESVGGKVEVCSEEGIGTEIKVTFSAEKLDDDEAVTSDMNLSFRSDGLPTISLVGFDTSHEGTKLLGRVLRTYLVSWWGFEIHSSTGYGGVVILNEDPSLVREATERRDISRPFIILSAARGKPTTIMAVASNHERIGGFCRILFKPGGPSRLLSILKLSLHALKIGSRSHGSSPQGKQSSDDLTYPAPIDEKEPTAPGSSIPRRNSEENHNRSHRHPQRPPMSLRSSTVHPVSISRPTLSSTRERSETPESDLVIPTISVGSGGSLLKSSVGTIDALDRRLRVLVVEDNGILRNLLIKWMSQKGYDFRDAVDGRDGVNIYETDGPFDVILLDLSMPILDEMNQGVAATAEIRHIETARLEANDPGYDPSHPTRILALTGMSSLEDKRRAFEAGVDGYLVKPVAFKTLDEMFHKLGIS